MCKSNTDVPLKNPKNPNVENFETSTRLLDKTIKQKGGICPCKMNGYFFQEA